MMAPLLGVIDLVRVLGQMVDYRVLLSKPAFTLALIKQLDPGAFIFHRLGISLFFSGLVDHRLDLPLGDA